MRCDIIAYYLTHRTIICNCAYWTISAFDFYEAIWDKDSTWGTATVRQRAIARLDLLAQATAEYGHLEGLGETAQHIAAKLRVRWPEVEPMPYYPPFR
jgi:hypothetical protein